MTIPFDLSYEVFLLQLLAVYGTGLLRQMFISKVRLRNKGVSHSLFSKRRFNLLFLLDFVHKRLHFAHFLLFLRLVLLQILFLFFCKFSCLSFGAENLVNLLQLLLLQLLYEIKRLGELSHVKLSGGFGEPGVD